MFNVMVAETAAGLNVEKHGNAVVVRFARPEIRSPLSVEVLDRLARVAASVSADRGVTALVFTGTEDVFASGADLREIAAVTSESAPAFALCGQRLMQQIAELPQPTIAAINGFCFGGALDLALACKMRIASTAARFAHPGAGLGIITGWGGTQRLPRLIGRARAMEMFFSAAPIDSANALAIHLIHEIADDPLERALSFVDD